MVWCRTLAVDAGMLRNQLVHRILEFAISLSSCRTSLRSGPLRWRYCMLVRLAVCVHCLILARKNDRIEVIHVRRLSFLRGCFLTLALRLGCRWVGIDAEVWGQLTEPTLLELLNFAHVLSPVLTGDMATSFWFGLHCCHLEIFHCVLFWVLSCSLEVLAGCKSWRVQGRAHVLWDYKALEGQLILYCNVVDFFLLAV